MKMQTGIYQNNIEMLFKWYKVDGGNISFCVRKQIMTVVMFWCTDFLCVLIFVCTKVGVYWPLQLNYCYNYRYPNTTTTTFTIYASSFATATITTAFNSTIASITATTTNFTATQKSMSFKSSSHVTNFSLSKVTMSKLATLVCHGPQIYE